jgi:hypothetical protein
VTSTVRYPVVELRQYTLRPGRRDVLIGIFEAHFMDLHERLGSTVIGHFRDLDDPDRFVFLRSFRDMPARGAALTAFFESEVFARNRGWRSARARTSSSRWRASPTGRATKPSIARRAGASLPETLRAGSTGRRRSCG